MGDVVKEENGEAMIVEDSIDTNKFDFDDRKIFVGGLTWETTIDELKAYFSAFGEVKDASIKTDALGTSRGFGFVLFNHPDEVEAVLAHESHSLNNKKIEPKKAAAREKIKKIFVGGFAPDVNMETLHEHFSKFGEIEKIDLPIKDQENKKHKGFCFVSFVDAASVDAATAKGNQRQEIGTGNVSLCDVKRAVPQHGAWQGNTAMGRGRGMPRGRGMMPPFMAYGYPPMGYPPMMGYPPFGGFFPRGGGKMARGARGRGRGGGRPY